MTAATAAATTTTVAAKALRTTASVTTLRLPARLTAAAGAQTAAELEVVRLRTKAYTSLKDIISPPGTASPPGGVAAPAEITIKNRLVKRAAWAYLRPMSPAGSTGGDRLANRIWGKLYCFTACLRFLSVAAGSLGRVLLAIRIRVGGALESWSS